jgi:hypothetical protein
VPEALAVDELAQRLHFARDPCYLGDELELDSLYRAGVGRT